MAGSSYLFIDESGNFDFSKAGSKYFILNAIVTDDPIQGANRVLAWRHHILTCDRSVLKVRHLRDCTHFHCSEDAQYTRDGVFRIIKSLTFESHGVMLQKNKANPSIQNPHDIYKLAFSGLIKGVMRRSPTLSDMQIFAAQLQIKPKKAVPILSALKGALAGEPVKYHIHFHPTESHHMLQISDYVCWAVARKWERGDQRSFVHIAEKVVNEFDYFRKGTRHYFSYV